MKLFGMDIDSGLELADKVEQKYKPAFDKFSDRDKAAISLYYLPRNSSKQTLGVTRPRIIKWYCPFADQRQFPSGHRYCINVYAGCSHRCRYCYAQGYEPGEAKCKDDFKKKLLKDLAEIEELNLPPAPVHLSNSTDPLQPLELEQKLTLYTLEQLQRYRRYFTSVVILTKNPAILTRPEYLVVLNALLPLLRIEVSLAFSKEDDAEFYDPGAPAVANRMAAIKKLRQNGIPIVLRIDPLLPRNPLPFGKSLEQFKLPDAQNLKSLNELVNFAADNAVLHVVFSVAKIVVPRNKPLCETMSRLRQVFELMSQPEKPVFRGGSWRLPSEIAKTHIVNPLLEICKGYDMEAYFCKQNLLLTL
jgi:DNA repair photolyase